MCKMTTFIQKPVTSTRLLFMCTYFLFRKLSVKLNPRIFLFMSSIHAWRTHRSLIIEFQKMLLKYLGTTFYICLHPNIGSEVLSANLHFNPTLELMARLCNSSFFCEFTQNYATQIQKLRANFKIKREMFYFIFLRFESNFQQRLI